MGISVVNKLFLIVASIMMSFGLFGQETINQVSLRTNPETTSIPEMGNYGINSFDTRKFKPEGTPYLDDTWLNGDIKLYDGKMIDDVPYRYNVVDETLVINLEDEYYTLPNSVFTQFSAVQVNKLGKISHRNFIRMANSDNTSNYYEILQSNGTASLALDHKAKLVKANYNTALDVGSPVDKYIQDQENVLICDDKVIKLKGSNKKILAQIADQNMLSYIKENNVNLKDNDQVSEMIKNY